jgi:stress-induced morphogen
LEYNFDLHSISIIPVGGNYFVGFVKTLQEFEIPSLIACDRDVLMNVNSVIKIDNFEIKTSSIFNQLNELDLLTDDDKQKLSTFKDSIIKIVPEKWKSSQEYRMYEEIKNDHYASTETKKKIASLISGHEIEIFDESKRSEINNFMSQLMAKHNFRIKILNTDFEGIFNYENFDKLVQECKSFYGKNKVLQGVHLASTIPKESIPDAIKDIIITLKSL